MAIVALDKVSFFGTTDQKAAVIDKLQTMGCLHLVNLSGDRAGEVPAVSEEGREALKYLKACGQTRRPATAAHGDFDAAAVEREALEIKERTRALEDELDEIRRAAAQLAPWGDFEIPPPEAIGGRRFWFYQMNKTQREELAGSNYVWREVARDHRWSYVAILAPNLPADVPGTRVELDPRPLSRLRTRAEQIEEELDELHYRRIGLTRWRKALAKCLDEEDDAAARAHASGQTLDDGRLFAISGWVPRSRRAGVEEFAAERRLAITISPPEDNDAPPTLLENPEPLAGGAGLVTFYLTPGYRMWDPSLTVLFSFAFFFGMILSDAAYAAVLGFILWRLWKPLGRSQSGRRWRNVFLLVVVFSLVYGVLVGSYFGVSPTKSSWLGRMAVINLDNQGGMMMLSIAIGIVHLVWANLMMAWRQRGSATALRPLGWATAMVGGYLWGVGEMGGLAEETGQALGRMGQSLFLVGVAGVLLFASQRPLLTFHPWQWLGRLFDGVKDLTRASSAFGDVLSYLRLFALGMSSAMLAATFNSLALGVSDQEGPGTLFALIILVCGHGLNLLMCLMSGVVHGLRLNCIEFFNWGLPEEGYLFRAFAKKARP